MAKTLAVEVQRKSAEHKLARARQALAQLVELYDSGKWRRLCSDESFASTVRQARWAFEHWTDIFSKFDRLSRD